MEFDEREEERDLDLFVLLGDFLTIAKRRLFLGILLVLVFAAGFAGRSYMTYQPSYTASATFTVRVATPLYGSTSSYNTKTAEQMAATFPSILTSGVLQERIRDHLGVSYIPAVSVTASESTSIIVMSVRDSDPQRAHDVLNAVITYYPEIAEYVVGPTTLILLDETGVPAEPDNPRSITGPAKKGAMMGAMIWAALVAVSALLKSTIHSEDELKQVLNAPCLGQIPTVKLPGRSSCPLVTRHSKQPAFAESVRLLRIRVQKAIGSKRNVLLVSSAIPGEGKTTVSSNLAASLALHGKKVLLVDCDLRNPSVAKALDISSTQSLYDFVTEKASVREIIVPSGIENLSVISGGEGCQDNAAELLSHEKTAALVKACRRLYDYVILDTPPCSLLADASEIAEVADCGLLVVRHDFASKSQIIDGAQRLTDAGLPLIGCVFNSVHQNLTDRYSYGYGYGYGYGSGGYGKYGSYGGYGADAEETE